VTATKKNVASFKRSFKGKGEASLKLAEHLEERTRTQTSMQHLINEWNTTFNSPPLSLTLKRQGYPRLMWRTSQKRFQEQRYVDVFGSDDGAEILEQLSKPVVDCLIQFELRRLRVNSDMKSCSAAVAAVRTQILGIEKLLNCEAIEA